MQNVEIGVVSGGLGSPKVASNVTS